MAIEHTDHYHDTVAGKGSSLSPVAEFWRLVTSSLVRRISHRKHLTGLIGTVELKEDLALAAGKRIARQLQARQFAKELIDFAEAHPIEGHSRWQFFRPRHFASHPAMANLLESLRIARVSDEPMPASSCAWRCHNVSTGHIAASLPYIKSAIAQKNKKAAKYENWGKADEKWLLIVAGGGDVNTHAPRFQRDMKSRDSDLKKLCCASPFDKIVFWERIGRWHKWLKS